MKKAGDSSSEALEEEEETEYDMNGITIQAKRKKRGAGEKGTFEPANSACECDEEDGSNECEERSTEKPSGDNDMCICAFDRQTNDAWPCHRKVGHSQSFGVFRLLVCMKQLVAKKRENRNVNRFFSGAVDKYYMSNV